VFGVQFENLLQLRDRLGKPAPALQGQAQLIVGMNGIWHLFERLLVMFNGLVPPTLGEEYIGQVVVALV